ncbi:MAG: hypothetical protein JWM11_2239 [Planctomycetaceae bacterium]|nr:hypothetical protein [Planctomycetaceae bacterium]
MTTLNEIEQAVQMLPAPELAEFRRWFTQFNETLWDAQIERDVAQGRLDRLAAEALADFANGQAVEL